MARTTDPTSDPPRLTRPIWVAYGRDPARDPALGTAVVTGRGGWHDRIRSPRARRARAGGTAPPAVSGSGLSGDGSRVRGGVVARWRGRIPVPDRLAVPGG